MNACVTTRFLADILRVLYQKLTLTAGQVALASRILAREAFGEATGGRRPAEESISLVIKYLGVSANFSVDEDLVEVAVDSPEGTCPLRDVCPLPFFLSESISLLSGLRCFPMRRENGRIVEKIDGKCSFRLRIYEE